ncbi:MAG: ATP-dependent Clp protease ATP-binding subunit [Lactobacillaceae bacterium]|nr:ATP-dependent Clp protease ATP-binding subunit [Lactobacillaceae bacterium]
MADNNNGNNGFNLDDIFRQLNGGLTDEELMRMQQNGGMMFMNPGQINNGNNGGDNSRKPKKPRTLLDEYGINLTELARNGKIDPVIGRDDEINRVIEILNRRTKNNPVLIGEPGVGKTAVVEGLALSIVSGEVPEKLVGKEVYRLDMVSMVQGTSMRGQFEQRMQRLIQEVSDAKNIILFIDEVHEIMGAGSSQEGSMDAGNILKPALARGEFQMVGATTLNEYRKIEKDGAMARRFQPVQVDEPTEAETVEILKGIRPKYEEFHQVKYPDEVLEQAVKLSTRYINDRFLPDKAIDLIDEVGSKRNLRLELIDESEIQKKIDNAQIEKQKAADSENFEQALYWQNQTASLEKQKELASKNKEKVSRDITVKDLLDVIEEKTKIPVNELSENDSTQLKNLEGNLQSHVIGQDKAVSTVAKAIRRNRVGLTKSGRPIGSFLFVGPTGVGKTETAKQLAKEMFGSEDAMIRFDMSEYMEPHSISKMIGAPAGYVGYEEAGQLTEQVRRHPYSLILLDEIEKAHKDVLNMFLQILDDGRLTDSQGHVVSFKDTIVIATSNAGTGDTTAGAVGFGNDDVQDEKAVLVDKLKNYFKPEFLNRFDAIVEFQPLDKKALSQIVNNMIENINSMIGERGLNIKPDKTVIEWLVDKGYVPEMGARPLRRLVQDTLEDQIADIYLDNPDVKNINADLVDNKVVLSAAKN